MMPLGSAEIEQIGTYVRANLAEWMEDIVGPQLLGRAARVEDELTFQRELICTRFEAVDKRFEEMLHRFDTVDKRFEDMHEIERTSPASASSTRAAFGVTRRNRFSLLPFRLLEGRPLEAKFWLDPAVEPAMSKGISAHESRAIQRIIERRKEEIVRAWRQHFAS